MTDNQERRRDYTVSRPVQVIYLLTWLCSIGVLLSFAGLVYGAWRLSDQLAGLDLRIIGLPGFVVLGFVASLLTAVALLQGIYAVVHTHRMVGSSYRIKTTLQALLEGNAAARVKLREDDYFLDVAEELNRYLEAQAATRTQGETPPKP